MSRRSKLAVCGLLACVGLAALPRPAAAWDPSTTHQGLLESALLHSAMHLRWMDQSELERGLFSSLRLDPGLLDSDELRLLQLAIAGAHADTGAVPLGGPGACPSADAPPETQQFCVDRDLWEHSALGWLRLGIVAEVTPSARQLHHFVDLEHPESLRWTDRDLPGVVLRSRARSNGEPIAGVATRTNFSGDAASAIAWLRDPNDLLAPANTYRHLTQASIAPTLLEREHHLAMALVGVGALLHVIQDLSVPAHARADATAFFAKLSAAPGDRGLPLQEFVRMEYGREALPGITPQVGRPSGVALTETLEQLVLGDDAAFEGVARMAAGHFFSEASLPAPKHIDDLLGAREAATALLGDRHGLDPVEVDGALLSPWPAETGYLLSPTGRALAAFDTDAEGRIRLYVDEVCYRDQANLLLPVAMDASRSVLDLLWPAWPEMSRDAVGVSLTIPAWAEAKLTVMIEDERRDRRRVGTHVLEVGARNDISLADATLAAGERVVLVLEAARVAGPPIVLEHVLGSTPAAAPAPALAPTPTTSETTETEQPAAEPPEPTASEPAAEPEPPAPAQ